MSLPLIFAAMAALENANSVALGINHAYAPPPEVFTDLPVAVRYNETPEFLTASRLLGRYNKYHIKVELHFARGVLQESYPVALACIEPFQVLYANNLSISGTCDVSRFREPPYDGPMYLRHKEGQPITIGIIFYMWAKEMLDDITVNL